MAESRLPGSVLVRGDLLCAWHGTSLLITTVRGECGDAHPLTGFYFREARFLRACVLEVNGEAPWLCEAAPVERDQLHFAYVFPEVAGGEGGGTGQAGDAVRRSQTRIPQRALEILIDWRVTTGVLTLTATIANRALEPLTFELAWRLDADFADIQEAQARNREQSGPVRVTAAGSDVTFSYGHAQLPYDARVSLNRAFRWDEGAKRAVMPMTLEPRQTVSIELRVNADDRESPTGDEAHRERIDCLRQWRNRFTRIASANEVFSEAFASNIDDFAAFPLLDGPPDEWLVPQAGVPLYPAFFGRDAVTAGWQAGIVDRGELLDASLTRLGRLQSNRVDDWRDEQPGRIPYQVRRGPLAVLNVNPYSAYYADFASPLMYVISLANLFAWSGDRGRLDAHWDTARRILDWARDYGDADRDGYLEYQTRSSKGTKNQGWKDSGDAVIDDEGAPIPSPIATCELQGYWYAAQQLMGVMCAARGELADSRAWFASATALKERFNRDWWSARENSIALAMDPDKRLVEAVTSNIGHCLATGIVADDRVPAVVGRLFAPDMFSGWGVRTLSSEHRHYDPVSYHRGSVWAVEQATILFGLRRYGFDARAHDLAEGLFSLAKLYPAYRIPETLGGYGRGGRPTPGAYPQANSPQLWNATAFPLMVQSLLGMVPWGPAQTVFVDPALPHWLPDLTLEHLRVGDSAVSIRFFRRPDGSSDYDVTHRHGTVHVVRQPSIDSLTATMGDRVWNAFSGVMK